MADAPEQLKMRDVEAGEPVKEQTMTKPEYLTASTNVANIRLCCPSILFKICPCMHCSIFTFLLVPIIGCCKCLIGCLKCDCIKGCVAGCCGCFKKCVCTLCAPCGKCADCIMGFVCKCCAPCVNCLKKFNCCNCACGLPCYNPPGCVCIFHQLCGLGVTCPYCCVTCGWKHCCLMPKEEQNWWRNQKVSKAEAKKLAQEAKAKKNDTAAKDKEIQELKAKVAQLESAAAGSSC